MTESAYLGPADASRNPHFVGPSTFARLPRTDIAVLGLPFDSGVTYRPKARFGPAAIREASRPLRPYNQAQKTDPFALAQVADAGDLAVNPFRIEEAIEAIEVGAGALLAAGSRLMTLGGDHTIALPLLRAAAKRHGPVALLHFDAPYTHGTPFRRAVEEGILDTTALCHIGGPLFGRADLDEDTKMGFGIITAADVMRRGADDIAAQLRQRIGNRPLYISADIDVLDPAHTPGTRTPEAGGLTTRELSKSCAAWPTAASSPQTWSKSLPPTTTPKSPPSPPHTSPTSSSLSWPANTWHDTERQRADLTIEGDTHSLPAGSPWRST